MSAVVRRIREAVWRAYERYSCYVDARGQPVYSPEQLRAWRVFCAAETWDTMWDALQDLGPDGAYIVITSCVSLPKDVYFVVPECDAEKLR